MKVLSLFDGMSCGRIALEKAGVPVEMYFASEVDKYAMKVTKHNYPDTAHVGDVKKLESWVFPKIDLLIGGSPCQGFSFAGKQKGASTKCDIEITTLDQYLALKAEDFEFHGQSYLFWEFMRLLHELKPRYFFLENVKMSKKWEAVLSEAIGVEPILINSALVSAQNRKRLYWTNIPNVTQPADKGILLKDILESGIVDREKSLTVTTRVAGATEKRYKEKSMHQMVIERPCKLRNVNPSGRGMNGAVFCTEGKSPTLTTNKGEGIKIDPDALCHHVADATDINGHDSLKRVYADTGKCPTINTMTGGNREPKVLIVPEATKKGFTEIKDGDCFDATFPTSRTRRGRNMKDKCNCLTAANYEYMRYEHPTYRKLTPVECERLQTVPDDYTSVVSNSQRYKMLGNGWTVDVIAHMFRGLL